MSVAGVVALTAALRESDPRTIQRLFDLSGIEMDFAFRLWLESRDFTN